MRDEVEEHGVQRLRRDVARHAHAPADAEGVLVAVGGLVAVEPAFGGEGAAVGEDGWVWIGGEYEVLALRSGVQGCEMKGIHGWIFLPLVHAHALRKSSVLGGIVAPFQCTSEYVAFGSARRCTTKYLPTSFVKASIYSTLDCATCGDSSNLGFASRMAW